MRALAPVSDPKLVALHSFTKAVTRSRGSVEDAELEAFKRAGLGDAAALEVVLATICNFANNLGRPDLNQELQA